MNTSDIENIQADALLPPVQNEVIRQAYQFVALSSAIAIQDAVDHLRNINTICTALIGAAAAQLLEDPSATDEAQSIIAIAKSLSADAAAIYLSISNDATSVLNSFPKGQ